MFARQLKSGGGPANNIGDHTGLGTPQWDTDVIVVTAFAKPRRNPYTGEIELDPFGDFGRHIFDEGGRIQAKINRCIQQSGLSREQVDVALQMANLGTDVSKHPAGKLFGAIVGGVSGVAGAATANFLSCMKK